jgi:hypothetical protein
VALFPGIDFNYFEPLDQEKSAISFNQDSVDKAAGNFGGQYGDVAFDPTQFARNFAQKISQGYGAVDRALGGVLPGGADSPYVGSSTTAAGRNAANDLMGAVAAPFGIGLGHAVSHALLNNFQKNPATHINVQTLNDVRQHVSNVLGKDIGAYVNSGVPPQFDPADAIANQPTISVDWASPDAQADAKASLYLGGEHKMDFRAPASNYPISSPVAMHELGHALNTGDPFANRLQQERGRNFNPAFIGGLSAGTSDKDGNKSLLMSGIQGALEEMTSPGIRHTLMEEALASKNAVNLANEFNLPKGIPTLSAAWGTYGTAAAAPGFATGVLAELGARGARALGNAIGDNIFDPIGDRIRGNDYNPLEQSLRKYGYNENDYRLAQPGGFGSPIKIQQK